MPRPRVVIKLSPSFLCVATHDGGTCLASRIVPLPHGDWPDPWSTLLDQTRDTLAALVGELGCQGATCRVLCQTPTSVVAMTSCAVSAGNNAAVSAATLQLTSLSAFGGAASSMDVRRLFQDSHDKGAASPPQVHMLAAADSNDSLNRLSEWAGSAGLTCEGACPTEAIAARAAVEALSSQPADGLAASLWMSETLGVLAVGNQSRLMFIRTIGCGSETLVDGLMKPLRGSAAGEGQEAASVALDRAGARSLLRSVGIPTAQQPLDGLPGLTGAALLPGLQPGLQRLAVEIKQSLRFGVSEDRRAAVRLMVCGPGSAIPNLTATLARLTGIELVGSDLSAARVAAETAAVQLVRLGDCCPCLTSRSTDDRMGIRRMRRALAAGVVAAACLLTVDGVSSRLSLARERERLAAIKAHDQGNAALANAQKSSLDIRATATTLENLVARRMGSAAPWGPLLGSIAASVPAGVRLTAIQMSAKGDRTPPTCTLRGNIAPQRDADSAASIKAFADALRAVPLVADVRLGSTMKSSAHGSEVRTFELTLEVIAVPNTLYATAEDRTGGPTP